MDHAMMENGTALTVQPAVCPSDKGDKSSGGRYWDYLNKIYRRRIRKNTMVTTAPKLPISEDPEAFSLDETIGFCLEDPQRAVRIFPKARQTIENLRNAHEGQAIPRGLAERDTGGQDTYNSPSGRYRSLRKYYLRQFEHSAAPYLPCTPVDPKITPLGYQ